MSLFDLLINDAGVALLDDLRDVAPLEQHLAVNLFGTHAVTQAFLPLLTPSQASLTNVLSLAALAPVPITPAYFDLKGGSVLAVPIAARLVHRAGA